MHVASTQHPDALSVRASSFLRTILIKNRPELSMGDTVCSDMDNPMSGKLEARATETSIKAQTAAPLVSGSISAESDIRD
jgi:hypothetical protein